MSNDTTGTAGGASVPGAPSAPKKKDSKDWQPLRDLRAGAVYELKTGERFLKQWHSALGCTDCASLDDGKTFAQSDDTIVREIPVARMGFPKLVRSEIPAILREQRVEFELSTMHQPPAVRRMLLDKLLEEVVELWRTFDLDGWNRNSFEEEAADVLEVLIALAAKQGVSFDTCMRQREEKARKRGTFEPVQYVLRVGAVDDERGQQPLTLPRNLGESGTP